MEALAKSTPVVPQHRGQEVSREANVEGRSTHTMGAIISKLKSVKICRISGFVKYLSLFDFTGKFGNGNVETPGLGKLVSAAGKTWLDLMLHSAA